MNFKYLQDIIILGMMINGDRRDVGGRFLHIKIAGPNQGMAEVEVNTVRLFIKPERLVDAQAYWDVKNKKDGNG